MVLEKRRQRHPDPDAEDHEAQHDRENLLPPSDVLVVVPEALIGQVVIAARRSADN